MSNFYLARPPSLTACALSAPVGSGKTRAAVEYMARSRVQNFLYVAPTIDLGRQTEQSIRQAVSWQGPKTRSVELINHETAEGKARHAALAAINETEVREGAIMVLTTRTFLDVLASIKRPGLWSVILDEAFAPATFDTFVLGADIQEGWDYFSEVFAVDASQGFRILPKEGRKGLVGDLADGRLTRVGGKYEGLQKVAKAVSNPASRCELVVTPRVRALIEGEPLPPKRRGSEDNVLEFASYISPEYFTGFREVLFLSALFEQTVLYALWTRALGVTFEEHKEFPADMLRDTHEEQGRFLSVGHLLHPDDTSSKENLGRDLLTGQPGGAVGVRVLDQVIRSAAVYFDRSRFLLQNNKGVGYDEGSPLIPVNAEWLRPLSHGSNRYQGFDNVVALCVTNPRPQQEAWVRSRTGMTRAEVTKSFRIHTAYQALGRCSIRKAEPTSDPKTVLVAGVDDARFLHSLFPGSKWLGQVGDLPSVKTLGKTSAKGPRQGKARTIAQGILQHLEGLDGVDRVSSRALKSQLKVRFGTYSPKVQFPEFPDLDEVHPDTWTEAVSLACSQGNGWSKQGSSLVRVTAESLGL